MTKNPIFKITVPIIEQDFKDALKLLHDNIFEDASYNVKHLKSQSVGEVLVAKINGEVVGALMHCRPGKIFKRLEDKYFDLKNIKADKKDIGFIEVLVVDRKFRRKGIGKALIMKAMEYQKEWNSKVVVVHSWQSSPGNGSEKLYTKLGFTAQKMHKSPWLEYSKDPKEDFLCVVCGRHCKCDDLEMVKYI